jgi:hypothetical protein
MKNLIILITFFVMAGIWSEATAQQFHRKTKHKTVKTETARTANRIAAGQNKYHRDANGVHKTCALLSFLYKPKTCTGYQPKTYKEIVAMSRANQRQWQNMTKKARK